jgi:hypothetical protein
MIGLERPRAILLNLTLLLLCVVLVVVRGQTQENGQVKGILFTLGTNQRQIVWPMARVTLKNLATGAEISVVSNQLGEFLFTGRRLAKFSPRQSISCPEEPLP